MDTVKNYLSVAFFAFWGGLARYGLTEAFSFYGTVIANLLGCFLLAFLTYFFLRTSNSRAWLTTGLYDFLQLQPGCLQAAAWRAKFRSFALLYRHYRGWLPLCLGRQAGGQLRRGQTFGKGVTR